MNSRCRKLSIESLEGRTVLSATAFADFNNDGLLDKAEITDTITITVSLARPGGSYDVSAILTSPKSRPLEGIIAQDIDADGDMDITAVASKRSGDYFVQYWLNHGDGTFDYVEPVKWRGPKGRWI